MTFAAVKSEKDPAPIDIVAAAASDLKVDVRPVEFDPALLPAGTPTSAVPINPADTQATVIPLPPAAWTGMAGLVGLGLIRARHKLRRFLS